MEKLIITLGNSWLTYPFLFITFYSISEFFINRFKFSNNIYFKYIQIFSFISITILILVLSYYILSNISIIYYMAPDPQNDPHLNLAKAFIDAASQVVDKIGNAAAAVGGAQAAAKVVAATMQNAPAPVKLGMIVGGAAGVVGAKVGMENLAALVKPSNKGSGGDNSSAIMPNRNITNIESSNNSENSSSFIEHIDNFINSTDFNSLDIINTNNLFILSPNETNIISLLFNGHPAEIVLSSILILSIVILLFTIILSFMLLLLYSLNSNINFNFLKNYYSEATLLYLNNKFKNLANLIGKNYKFNILICILLIIIFDCFIIHMVFTILNNLEVFCSNYLENFKK